MNSLTNSEPRILVIVESATIRALITSLLEAHNLSVECAMDGEQGLEILQQAKADKQAFDGVIIDYFWSAISAIEMLTLISKDASYQSVVVMILTERADQAIQRWVDQRPNTSIYLKQELKTIAEKMCQLLDHTQREQLSPRSIIQHKKILFVDDSLTVCAKYQHLLQSYGYEVDVAHSKKQALEKALSFKPLLAIIDYYMPDGDGNEVCRELKADPRTENITLVMHSQRRNVLEDSLEAGAIDLICKDDPVNIFLLRLASIIDTLLAQQHTTEQQVTEQLVTQQKAHELKILQDATQKLGVGLMIESEQGWLAFDSSMEKWHVLFGDLSCFDVDNANNESRKITSVEGKDYYFTIHELMNQESQRIAMVQDVTHLVESEAQRQGALLMVDKAKHETEAAEQSNRLKSEFLANMSHEMRTPMHAVISFCRLATKKATDPKQIKFLDNINTSAQRLMRLLNNLMDLSKLESGHTQLQLQSYDLIDTIQKAISQIQSLAADKKITIAFAVAPVNKLEFDQDKIIQVLINLLSNAIKFSPENSQIDINVQQHDELINVSVCDQGLGIPKNELDSIFDKFTQSSLTDSKAGGTGLGLAICKEIMLLHKGNISVTSPPSETTAGAVFGFYFPLNLAA